ncbi:MAG TPA: helix-turn-helix transcriptional regulator [Actinomycetota bacterium]|nr:helix-turn-helix transcriptional regulator [Actinomycetota bacterium]
MLALADNPSGWSHGYHLCRQLDLKAGTVYPILMRLAERGQVETAWETEPPSGRPARHLYRLTGEGARLAEALRTAAAAEQPRASRSGGVIRPPLGAAF